MHARWLTDRGVMTPGVIAGPGNLVVGFTTREAGDFGEQEARTALRARYSSTRLRLLHQVHGVDLLDPATPGEKPEADGWAGALIPGELVAVKAADCLPVLLWSGEAPLCAAVHAGWRGAVAGIARRAVERLGVDPRTLNAALGPCICPSCFEVGAEVAEAAGDDPRWLSTGKPGKYHLDLAAFVVADLVKAGVPVERIAVLGLCTSCRSDLFWSWRGEVAKQRMIGFLGLVG